MHKKIYSLKETGEEISTKDSADFVSVITKPETGDVNYQFTEYYKTDTSVLQKKKPPTIKFINRTYKTDGGETDSYTKIQKLPVFYGNFLGSYLKCLKFSRKSGKKVR